MLRGERLFPMNEYGEAKMVLGTVLAWVERDTNMLKRLDYWT